jgi:small GTP-binding protein
MSCHAERSEASEKTPLAEPLAQMLRCAQHDTAFCFPFVLLRKNTRAIFIPPPPSKGETRTRTNGTAFYFSIYLAAQKHPHAMSRLALQRIAENKKTKDPYLDLGCCGMTEVPEEIGDCTWLETLILSNEWQDFDLEKRSWETKTSQNEGENNNLRSLPPTLPRLLQLKKLVIAGDYSGQWGLSDLSPLQNLTKLTILDFRGNKVSELKPLQNLTNLTELNFSENQVNELPAFFRDFKKLDFLFLRENKFEVGAEIYNLDSAEQIEAILQWQASRARQDLRPILEAKIMFIGDSKKGKTHLIEMLLTGAFRPDIPTTHGIERHRLPDVTCPQGAVRVNVWDLGGQQFMRSTHQYFFTERTLYVLVAEAREERKDLNHWLQLAKEIGKESPVLVVVNKIDLDPHDLDRASLQTDYPNICDFVRTSIHDKPEAGIVALDTIRALREKIGAIVTDPRWMPGVYAERPSEWFTVKERLEALEKKEVDFISYADYEKLEHISSLEEAERRINLKLLASLGTVVTFEDKLKDIDNQVINPQWLLDGVYKILNDPTVKDERKGLFTYADLERILDDQKKNGEKRFPRTRYPFLLELMQSNGLCYPVENEKKTYLLPDLFSDAQPEKVWEYEDVMRFRYNYDTYPPDAFMTRFIVAKHADIVGEKRWRSGVVISNGTCSALVRRAFAREHIEVEVHGPDNERRDYLAVIRETFRKLHETYENLEIKREVPYKTVWLNFDYLLTYQRDNEHYFHPVLREAIPVAEILNGYRESRGEFPNRGYFEEKLGALERSQERTRQEARAGFKKADKKLDALTALSEQQLELLLENKAASEAFFQKMDAGVVSLLEKLPAGHPVAEKGNAYLKATDLKLKIKLGHELLGGQVEAEMSVDVKKIFRQMKKDALQIVADFRAGHIFLKPD